MTKNTKRALFYSAAVVFLLLSYILVLYAQGYKYSFSEHKFLRTGAIYLKTNTEADVFLDNRYLNSTSFFGNTFTINRLLPGRYSIRISKDNFYAWKKTVVLEEGLVTEFTKIILLPDSDQNKEDLKKEIKNILYPTPTTSPKATESLKPIPTPSNGIFYIKNGALFSSEDQEPQSSASNVVGLSLSVDGKKLLWWTNNELWILWLEDTNYQPYLKKGEKELITKFSGKVKAAAWFRDNDHVVVDSNGYRVIEIDKRGGINVVEI